MIKKSDIRFGTYPITSGEMLVGMLDLRVERAIGNARVEHSSAVDPVDHAYQAIRNQIINHIYGDIERKVHELRHAVLPKINTPDVTPVDEMFQELIGMLNQ